MSLPDPAGAPAVAEQQPSRSALEITVSYGESTLDVRHLVGQKSFIIGEGKAVDMTVSSDDLPASEFPLVRAIDGQFVLTFLADQRGEVERDGAFYPLQWLKQKKDDQLPNCFRYSLGENERATLRFGGLTITARYVSPPDRVENGPAHREQHYTTLLLALSVFLVLALGGGLLMSVRPENAEQKEDFWAQNPRVARMLGHNSSQRPTRVRNVVLDTSPLATGLDAQQVSSRIAAEADALSACVAMIPDGGGIRATLRVVGGAVTDVSTEALNKNQGDEGLGCVRDVLLRVPMPPGQGRVVYTLGISRQ